MTIIMSVYTALSSRKQAQPKIKKQIWFCEFDESNQIAPIGLLSTHIQTNSVDFFFSFSCYFLTSQSDLYIKCVFVPKSGRFQSDLLTNCNARPKTRYFIWHLLHAFREKERKNTNHTVSYRIASKHWNGLKTWYFHIKNQFKTFSKCL